MTSPAAAPATPPAPGDGSIQATLYTDPGCPWAYSAIPALRVLDWRYGTQLRWRLVMIGLSEDASRYEELGYTPLRAALGQLEFRRYGMPFSPEPKTRMSATARACRAVVAARLGSPGSEWRVLRALQLAPIKPAPRTCISRIAIAICATVLTFSITKRCGKKR